MGAGGCMGSGTSSEGSIFMALTILSPSRVEAHRLRDDSEPSDMGFGSIEPAGGRPFKLGGDGAGLCGEGITMLMGGSPGAGTELTPITFVDDEEAGPRD